MPQISKIRIVNFNYNDGKRLIADELYDFASAQQDEARNVLINLANGGGKSVLVQLMMQPIIPKAKVAGRRIELFFTKPTDHCFVLLEWLKDNSNEKLLTGIAMAAGMSSALEDESSRGMSIKYYTFYSNYSSYTTPYDIVNMPLSKKENGRFIPAAFDEVRTLARKSNGVLNYYVSDDSPKWQKKLAEYGLIQSEWRMIEKLNSEEGGLGKFFGDFKTSDQLVDRLLIPTIEGKLNHSYSREDNSLATMLVSFAHQYASKQDILREKETFEDFSRSLASLQPEADHLWSANETLDECTRSLFGLSDALGAELDKCNTLCEQYTADLERLENQRLHIEHERASLDYYLASDAFISALSQYAAAEETEQSLSTQLCHTKHRQLVLECAEYYQKLLRIEGELEAIRKEIARRETGGENGQEIARLRYSISLQLDELLSRYEPQLDDLRAQFARFQQEKAEWEQQFAKSQQLCAQATEACTRADERLRSAENETDREIQKYDIDLYRRLDRTYAEDELAGIHTAKLAEQKGLTADLENAENALADIEQALSAIPQKKFDLSQKQAKTQQEATQIQNALNAYYATEEQIREICTAHNLDFSLRFTDHIQQYLASEQRANQARHAEIVRKISISSEEIDSAKRGSLHIPHAVIDYLNSTGVRYSTCEKYLNTQVSEGKLTSEQCLEILRNYPAAAFGVLMEASEKERFFAYGREKWLPAMIPLYTYDQMHQILSNARKFDGAIAFFCEEYFANTQRYIDHLEGMATELHQQQSVILSAKETLDSQMETVKSFAYHDSFAQECKTSLAHLEQEIGKAVEKLSLLEGEEAALRAEKKQISDRIREFSSSLANVQRILDGIRSVEERISQEFALATDLQNQKLTLADLTHKHSEIAIQRDRITQTLHTTAENILTLETNIGQIHQVQNVIGECEKEDIIEGTWEELYAQYNALQSVLDQELVSLQAQQDDKLQRKREYEKEIGRRDIPADEYRVIPFDESQLDSIRIQAIELEKTHAESISATKMAGEKKGKAQGELDAAQKVLFRFGDPLDKSAVGTNFEARLENIHQASKDTNKQRSLCQKKESQINGTLGRLQDLLKAQIRPKSVLPVQLDDSFAKQYENLSRSFEEAKRTRSSLHAQVRTTLQNMQHQFAGSTCGVLDAISGMLTLLSSDMRGDRYFTLIEHISGDIQNTQRAIAKIATDLKEFENNQSDLIRQCALQGQRVYEGLQQMASSSRVTVYNGKDKKQMIRFDIPAEVDPVVAFSSIEDEIIKGTQELVAKISENADADVEIKKLAEKIIGSKNLLRKYIGKESIKVDAYKIDQNPQNAGYRSWEQTQVNNSGAEKFVVYFAVILSLMNYTRGDFGSIRDKDLRSSLILDNPFGATSSKHILIPMFAIAKHFRVQMVCLSDINKADVINCFDIVIKAIVKKRPMSNHEILTHDGNESIEHGFYRTEQLSLL